MHKRPADMSRQPNVSEMSAGRDLLRGTATDRVRKGAEERQQQCSA
jgi:hypothetical protein